MLEQARLSAKANSEECDVSIIKSESDEVYLRLGDGALEDIFNIHYKDIKSDKHSHYKKKFSRNFKFLNG